MQKSTFVLILSDCEYFEFQVNNTLSLDAIERIAKHWPLPTK